MNAPYDTSKTDPMLLLAESMGPGGPSGMIERQERQGQREMVNSTVIPAKLNCSEEELVTLGFILGDPVDGDCLFRHAELLAGWKREGSDHAMWSHIVDELGRARCSIFYKASWYDRDAFISVETVYSYVGRCLSEKTTPILDEVWATRDAVKAAAVGHVAQNLKYLGLYENSEDDYGRERAVELRAEIAACLALYAEPKGAA
ncbi:hypothetical protein ABT340_41370 [Streptosporangium sp. NPDC000239]|uniref:hypothetical protein n=1 Tax=Streptosporangium sp. NPDC000239 TaxID=3154248 RepID=UPI00332CD856